MASVVVKPNKIQQAALLALQERHAKALTVLPSGIGKTHLAAFHAKEVGAKRILFIAHRIEIVEQAESIFRSVYELSNDSLITGFVTRKKKEYHKQMIFATIQTLSKEDTLDEISKINFDYVVIDEFHHVAAKTYQSVLSAIRTKFLHGLTATPYRLDGKNILTVVDDNVPYSMELQQGIESGELVPFHYHALYDNIDYSDIKWLGYKYRESDLNKKLLIEKRDCQIITEYEKAIRNRGKATLLFCVSVKHADRMAELLRDRGILAEAVTYETPASRRSKIVQDFRTGKIDALCLRDIFNEGIDFPEVSVIMFLRPTFSRTVFYQQLGRGLRKGEGKSDVLVYDFVSNYHNAYQIKQWLSFATTISSPISNQEKPEYQHNVSTVYFDKKVLDIFELQEKQQQKRWPPYTTEALIEEYRTISVKIGFNPGRRLLEDLSAFEKKYGFRPKYPESVYRWHFGSWPKFIKLFIDSNYVPREPVTFEKLTAQYDLLSSKLKRRYVSQKEWKKEYRSLGSSFMQKNFGGFAGFRKHLKIDKPPMSEATTSKTSMTINSDLMLKAKLHGLLNHMSFAKIIDCALRQYLETVRPIANTESSLLIDDDKK